MMLQKPLKVKEPEKIIKQPPQQKIPEPIELPVISQIKKSEQVPEQQPQTQQISIIKIGDEQFINEEPPQCKIIYSLDSVINNNTVKDLVIVAENDSCTICRKPSTEDNPKTIFKCKHWTCFKCTNQKTPVCPICEKHKYVKLPLNTDKSETYDSFIRNSFGKQGLIKSIKAELSIEQKLYLNFHLVKNYDLSENTYKLTIDSLYKKNITLPIIYHCLNVKTRNGLYNLGLTNMHIYDKRFTIDTEILKKYGIDKDYINERAEIEGFPVIYLRRTDEEIETTPVEAMFRNGYILTDFIDLGWYSEDFVKENVPPVIYSNVIKTATDRGMKSDTVNEIFKVKPEHLKYYGISLKTKDSPKIVTKKPVQETKSGLILSNSMILKNLIDQKTKKKSGFTK